MLRIPSFLSFVTAAIAVFGCLCGRVGAQEISEQVLSRTFTDKIQPLLQTHCYACHGKEKTEAKLDLSAFSTLEKAARSHATWETVRERLAADEMPPEEAQRRPSPAER